MSPQNHSESFSESTTTWSLSSLVNGLSTRTLRWGKLQWEFLLTCANITCLTLMEPHSDSRLLILSLDWSHSWEILWSRRSTLWPRSSSWMEMLLEWTRQSLREPRSETSRRSDSTPCLDQTSPPFNSQTSTTPSSSSLTLSLSPRTWSSNTRTSSTFSMNQSLAVSCPTIGPTGKLQWTRSWSRSLT